MATKTLNVRISNRYDNYEAWMASTDPLLKGELAIVTVTTTQTDDKGNVINVPCTMMKCGMGDGKTFAQLPWISALGADTPAWSKAANPPTVNASDVVGLEDFIGEKVEDTNTKYRLITEDNMTYKLQSTNVATPTDDDWTDVTGSTFTKTTVITGTSNGSLSVNGTDVQVKGFSDLSTQVEANKTAIETLNGTVTTEGSVDYKVSEAKTEMSTMMDNKVAAAIASTYKPAGSTTFADLTAEGMLAVANVGKVYNVTDAFTTNDNFIEGAGKSYPVGTNVVIINAGTDEAPEYKYDVLQGFVDLSNYSTTTEMNTAIENAIGGLTADQIPSLPADKITNFDQEVADAVNTELNKELGEGETSALQTTIATEAGKVATEKINALDFTDTPADGEFVTSVTQKDGLINVNRSGITLDQIGDVASGSTVVLNCGGATV